MKKTEWLVSIIFFIVGIVILALGIVLQINNHNFEKIAVETQATITDITSYRDSDGDTNYRVQISFWVDGKEYRGSLGEWHTGMREGGKTKVYYNPKNPEDFRGGSVNFVGYIVIGMGSIFFLVGGLTFVSKIKKIMRIKEVKQNGRIVSATIDSVERNINYSVNGKHPYIISCSYNENNKLYEFESENIWFNAKAVIESNNIKTIPVYISEENPKEYHVEIEELKQYIGN